MPNIEIFDKEKARWLSPKEIERMIFLSLPSARYLFEVSSIATKCGHCNSIDDTVAYVPEIKKGLCDKCFEMHEHAVEQKKAIKGGEHDEHG